MHESFLRLSSMTDKEKSQYMDYYNNVLLIGLAGFKFYKPNQKSDDKGLYFDADYLKKVGVSICLLALELMSEYRDVITEEKIDHWNKFGKKIKVEDLEPFNIKEDFNSLNATSLGNIAYMILHSKNEYLVNYFIKILNQIFVKYKGVLLQQMNDII